MEKIPEISAKREKKKKKLVKKDLPDIPVFRLILSSLLLE